MQTPRLPFRALRRSGLNSAAEAARSAALPQGVAVRPAGEKGGGLFATRPFNASAPIFTFSGELVPAQRATPLALQIDANLFLESTAGYDDYLNHCCEPSCAVVFHGRQVELVALRPVLAGQELSFDYLTTEWDLYAQEHATRQPCVFECACGAPACRGVIMGFRYLPGAQQCALAPRLSPFLRRMHRAIRAASTS